MLKAKTGDDGVAYSREIATWMRLLEEAGGITLRGFRVDALDGPAGKIEQVLYWSDARTPDYIVIDSRRWLFGRKSVLSVQTIDDVDVQSRRLKISLNREQIRRAPEFLPWT